MHAFLLTGALAAAVFLCLRYAMPGTGAAEAVGQALGVLAGRLGFMLTLAIFAVTLVAPLLPPDRPITQALFEWALPVFDEGVTLAIVLSGVAALAVLVSSGRPGIPFLWFTAQAALAWACHRLRQRLRPA